MGRNRYHVIEDIEGPYFITCTVVNWIVLFNHPNIVEIIFDSFRFLIDEKRLQLHGWIIMENHLHAVVSSPDMKKEVGDFKSWTARCIVDQLKKDGRNRVLKQLIPRYQRPSWQRKLETLPPFAKNSAYTSYIVLREHSGGTLGRRSRQ